MLVGPPAEIEPMPRPVILIFALTLISASRLAYGLDPDSDSDGMLSAGEVRAAQETMFYELDRDGNGFLSLVEALDALTIFGDSLDPTSLKENMSLADYDQDGLVSKAEFLGYSARRFEMYDANGDHHLTPDEIQTEIILDLYLGTDADGPEKGRLESFPVQPNETKLNVSMNVVPHIAGNAKYLVIPEHLPARFFDCGIRYG